jgi:peptidoglycan hydrolase CwlO-like protein
MIKKILLFTTIFCFSLSINVGGQAYAQTPSIASDQNTTITTTSVPNNNEGEISKLNDKIRELEGKISDVKKQETSLTSQISVMDNQIQLTQYRITLVQEQINEATLDIDTAAKRIKNLENSLQDVSEVLLNRIKATYQAGETDPMRVLLASTNLQDFLSRESYLKLVQEHDKELLYNTQQAKIDYANQKSLLESKKKKIVSLSAQLEGYNKELDSEKDAKENLLQTAKSDERNYKDQLAAARRQVASFKSFATSRVGSGGSTLPAQSSPDGWYYNQRDERWGKNLIGSSTDQVWEVGCLLTSVAMVLKKNGEGVTPGTIAASSGYFYSTTAAMNLPWGGGRFSSAWGANTGAIDSKLAAGQPVIVGVNVSSNSVGTHFLVLKSGQTGDYTMNDPWNGPNLRFSDYYSTGQIFQYGWLN